MHSGALEQGGGVNLGLSQIIWEGVIGGAASQGLG